MVMLCYPSYRLTRLLTSLERLIVGPGHGAAVPVALL